jgi:hypothetical protein
MRAILLLTLAGCGAAGAEIDPLQADTAMRLASLDANPYGINAHAARDEMLEQMLDIGIGWYRVDCEWSVNEPVEGQYYWDLTDRLVETVTSHGGSVILQPSYSPSWASGSTDPAVPPHDPSKFVRYVREAARRYRGVSGCMGIWNEPNLRDFWKGTKSQFINDILVPSLRAIREEAPEMVICGPDLSSSGDERRDWMEPILGAAGDLLDVITHHQYDGDDTVSGRVSEIERMHDLLVRKGHGHKPLWITETGWDAPRFSRSTQANNLRGMLDAMRARSWWGKTIWYDSHGIGWGIFEGESGVPTLSFNAYRDYVAAHPSPSSGPAPAPACDPVTQPAPHFGERAGQCLPSCGVLGGRAYADACANHGMLDAGAAYDVPYCCRSPETQPTDPTPAPICDPVSQPAPHWGERNGGCYPSCGALGGTAAFGDPCANHGMLDAGTAYDVAYCCRAGESATTESEPPAESPLCEPGWGEAGGECLPSCVTLGGDAWADYPCELYEGYRDAGAAYDVPYCCVFTGGGSVCDPATQPSPWYGEKDGACLPACFALGGWPLDEACSNWGMQEIGPAYDTAHCCY